MKLRCATIAQVTAQRAKLDSGDASGAVITRSRFAGASMRLCILNDAEIQECSFENTNLEGTKWRGARLSNVAAQGAMLFHSDLRATHFIDCDFRDADLQGFRDSGSAGAVFIRCDLRAHELARPSSVRGFVCPLQDARRVRQRVRPR